MWVQHKGDDSWIGLTFCKQLYQYVWVDNSSTVFQNAWVIRRTRRYKQSTFDCGVAFKKYLSVTDCSLLRKWICKREEVVDLFTEHVGRAIYLPNGKPPKYATLDKAKEACLVLQKCTGVVAVASDFMLHTGMEIYNTRGKNVITWIKSDCAAGRFGEMCEHICRTCDDGVSCNPRTGLCGDSLFCSITDPYFTCEKGSLIGGRCPTEEGWLYWYGSCYYISRGNTQNWLQARHMCRRYRGTDLVWITSANEKKTLLSLLPRGVYWSGLHGNWFCNHLHWSNMNVSYAAPEWLRTGHWTFSWRCCVYLTVPEGSMPGTNCNEKASWICKKKEDEAVDFRMFGGYYLVGIATDVKAVTHKSLSEAFQHCRLERTLCTGVQKIRDNYMTILAKRLVLISGSFVNLYTAYLKSACTPGYYGPRCHITCTCNGTENCNPLTGQCAENEQCNEDYLTTDCEKGTVLPQIWVASMLKDNTWIGLAVKKAKDTTNFDEIYRGALPTCPQMNRNGTIEHVKCSSLAAWVCKRSVDAKMFWKYNNRILILPLGNKMYNYKEHAKSACFLEEKCTGITYWKKKYVPVRGKELILPMSSHDATYIKTACSDGHYGPYCQEKCPDCPKDRPCNRLTGKCAVEVSCPEKENLWLCEIQLKSKFCYYQWVYFNNHCYYISTYGQINKSDAEYMCSQYKGARLIHLATIEQEVSINRTLTDIEELCIQLDPSLEHLISTPCSHNASWVCEARLGE
ncbi:hypothetical protein JD844_012041 [Phrynosoma platyrhinos]|uniref:C-type lectin domain-containing protein n=1 Tax=Phrynosoma platyrhinos TaxID=52577 RepID=A0ABQ7TJ08_PHRPL|nr:hypothetical protein JD844_012041 [Phrynosoma platyrhinos]